jgi:cytochrome c-type biogenesis protein CcmH
MIAFAGVAAAMVAAALAWILVPLLRGSSGTGAALAREASNVAILRDQLRELETDLANGAMPRDQYEQAKGELERRVLEESRALPGAAAFAPSAAGAMTAAIVAGSLPLAAILLYVALGNFDAFSPRTEGEAAARPHDVSPEKIDSMLKEVEARLAQNPGDAEGWIILARTNYQLSRFPDAARAFERAVALVPDDAALLADYADALGATQGGTLQGKPLELVTRALTLDPANWKALALAGTAAFDRKEYAQAVTYWERMKATVPANSPVAQSIDASIAEARQLGGLKGAPATPPVAVANAPAAAPATKPPAAVAPAGAVTGTVTLSPAVAAKASPEEVVFIFARAAQGPRMPIAIVRKQVRDLPYAFTLDDSMAMTPESTLSKAGEVVVGARISRSGQAMPQSGDVEGYSSPVKVGTRGVAVVIEKAIP